MKNGTGAITAAKNGFFVLLGGYKLKIAIKWGDTNLVESLLGGLNFSRCGMSKFLASEGGLWQAIH